MHRITENIFGFTRFYINVYVIDTGKGLTLVDTHISPSVVSWLEKALPQHGLRLDQINNILITHAHTDHVGGLAALQNKINVRTLAHRRDAAVVRGEQPMIYPRPTELKGIDWVISHFTALSSAPPARIDGEIKEGDTLNEILRGLQVVELPGHTYGQIGFWWQEKRLLIGGDVMMHLPWGLTMPTRAASPDWEAVKQSIRKVADMNVDILCLGHGSPIVSAAAAKIKALAQKVPLEQEDG